ncbi:Dual specificity protein phosphatase 13 isoform A [Oryzias melastigma]|uniref:Dual specificity protein phosphatase n=1 Tax=Oryzias melastigma TaxID=30732 RepID=A0A834KXE6_ORYME|nr:Dual specificity protein phosphatase 13 isoform A [Oryzias melastigma]
MEAEDLETMWMKFGQTSLLGICRLLMIATACGKLRITHVVNAAHGKIHCQGSHDFYGPTVDYYGIPADDSPSFNLFHYFSPSAEYIQKALDTNEARVLVHCAVGVSRSASIVLAYLMIQHHYSLMEAISKVKENRFGL